MTQQLRELRSVIDRMPIGTYQRSWWDRYYWYREQSTNMMLVVGLFGLCWLPAMFSGKPQVKMAVLAMVLAAGILHFALRIIAHFLKQRAPDQE